MKYKRTDNNQKEIVNILRSFPGISVVDISSVGKGIGDLLVGFNNNNFLFEIMPKASLGEKSKRTKS